jgi:hypothetical protein
MTMASRRIQQILHIIQDSEGKDPALLIQNIQSYARSALDLLQSGADPFEEKIAVIVLLLKQSTRVTEKMINGRMITRVSILDQDLYNVAMARVHKLPGDPEVRAMNDADT